MSLIKTKKQRNNYIVYFRCILFFTVFFLSAYTSKAKETIVKVSYLSQNGTNSLKVNWDLKDFEQTSLYYNSSLAKASLALSAAAYHSEKQEKPTIYIDTALKKMKFEVIEHGTSYNLENRKKDGAGYTIAFQNINQNKELLLAVVIEGTQGIEWYGNLNIADSLYNKEKSLKNVETHESFETAAKQIIEELEKYIERHKEEKKDKDIKIWITGHSRGGAIANLIAGKLVEEKKYKQKNIFSYTFAAPNVTTKAKRYKNIYNIINGEDLVPYCPLENSWNFKRYGITYLFPIKPYTKEVKYQKKLKQMKKVYQKQTGKAYKGKIFESTQPLISFTEQVEQIAGNVEEYYKKQYIILDNNTKETYTYSLKEYLNLMVDFIMEPNLGKIKIFTNSANSSFAPIIKYLTTHTTDGQILGAHMPDTYISWLEVTKEDDFIDISEVSK